MFKMMKTWFKYNIYFPLRNLYWWFQHNFNPRHRYHMLDLRQPKWDLNYRHGWIDSDTKMVYALFNILNRFVERELPNFYIPTEEEIVARPEYERECLKTQRKAGLEIIAIHNWWTAVRPVMQDQQKRALNEWHTAHKAKAPNEQELFKRIDELDEKYNTTLEDYMIRLIKVRGSMWT